MKWFFLSVESNLNCEISKGWQIWSRKRKKNFILVIFCNHRLHLKLAQIATIISYAKYETFKLAYIYNFAVADFIEN